MELPEENFGPETVELMGRALTEAWSEIRDNTVFPTRDEVQGTALYKQLLAAMTKARNGRAPPIK